MAEPKVELRRVKDELYVIEQQLESLLERQAELMEKKSQLETTIKDAAKTAAPEENKDWERSDFEWSKRLDEYKTKAFKVNSFRPLQLSTMNATLAGRDCILIMPTGGGKSLCFQLPAVISKGVTLVVSPLVSLMEDQLMGLGRLGVNAEMLSASSTKEHVNAVHAAMTTKNSQLKLLYVTPERLAKSKRFMNKLEKMYEAGAFSRLVIDEVHCCSQWGHDFRPDFKFLGVMRRQFPGVPILGLTATATNSVVTDVRKILQLPDCLLFRASFNRTNLFYEVLPKPSNFKEGIDEMKKIIESRFSGQSGIVYCFSRKDTEEVARELQLRNINSGCYHGDMAATYRSQVHQAWMADSIQVVVATIAFGMGIDKPNVRFVMHHSMSKSMENYYQESGRAGRDDEKATCILFRGYSDIYRQSTMVFTEQTGLEKLYNMVAYAQDVGSCRRTLIARHFGERWNRDQCNKMCDHCQKLDKGTVVKKDISNYCRDILRILENAQAIKQRITALKLMDAWQGKGATLLRVKSISPPKLSASQCERVLAHMLVQGYIREDFHFTPYSTISYQVPGTRSALLNSAEYQVKLEFFDKSAKTSSPSSASASSSSSKPTSEAKPNPITNTDKSTRVKAKKPEREKRSCSSKDSKKPSKKRKPLVVESDSDLDLLDAEEDFSSKLPTKKVKMGKVSERRASSSITPNNECIILDASDEEKPIVQKEKRKKMKVESRRGSCSDIEDISEVYMEQLGNAQKESAKKKKRRKPKDALSLSQSITTSTGFAFLNLDAEEGGGEENGDSEVVDMDDSEDDFEQIQTMYTQQLNTLEKK